MSPKRRKPGPVTSASDSLEGGKKLDTGAFLARKKFKSLDDPRTQSLAKTVQEGRLSAGASVADFPYNKKRVRLMSPAPDLKEGARGIMYWMSRDQRVQDTLPIFVTQHGIGGVVTDFSPLRVPMQWVQDVQERLPSDVPLAQVLESPWGQVAVQRAILEVRKHRTRYKESVEGFVEEAVVRRELADNFCFYNPNYDKVEGNGALRLLGSYETRRPKDPSEA
ncbi:putative Deoxyribodipyrimidine photo-lyase-like protein [Naja naja]|nr:putative Deoxyribodipyrimidine photo-lyase-like protein [Naja naja]